MIKLKLSHFRHIMRKQDTLEKIIMRKKIEGRRKNEDRISDGLLHN